MCIICYILSCSPFLLAVDTPYTNDFSNISMIELCRHCGEAESPCAQFQFQPFEVYLDEVVIAQTTELWTDYCLLSVGRSQ